jgi:hypothetical protein
VLSAVSENSDVDATSKKRKQDGQWIRWQRCEGGGNFSSAYGPEGTGKYDDSLPDLDGFTAIDPNNALVAEVYYSYTPQNAFGTLLSSMSELFETRTLRYESVFIARELELTSVTNSTGATPKLCD